MDFHEYVTLRDLAKRLVPRHSCLPRPKRFYQYMFDVWWYDAGDSELLTQAMNELDWELQQRPYYRVWPGIVPLLTKLNLDIGSDLIHPPVSSLCIRLPKNAAQNPLKFAWNGQQICVASILMGEICNSEAVSMQIECQPGDVISHPRVCFPRKHGVTVEQWLASSFRPSADEHSIHLPEKLLTDCVRLCCTLCLLDNDPSVISPDVLANDRMKYEATADPKYVEKAHRKHKFGWDVGRHIEKIPHYRRPHLMLVWTGTGRKVPKIVPRKGSIVHRNAVEKIPTGFMGMEPQENTPGQVSSET